MEIKGGGSRIVFDVAGEGAPVVLIHGFPLNRQMWKVQAKALAGSGFRVVTVDLPGFGGSQAPESVPSIADYADSVIAVMDSLGITAAVVGGMSMGGYVLLDILERYPARVAAALFLMTRSGADDEAGRERRTRLAKEVVSGNIQAIVDAFIPVLFTDETIRERPALVEEVREAIVATDPRGISGALLAMRERRDYTPLLPNVSVPALVVAAEKDRAMTLEQAEIFRKGLPSCDFCVMPGAGHAANLERADDFDRCLLEFLEKIGWNRK